MTRRLGILRTGLRRNGSSHFAHRVGTSGTNSSTRSAGTRTFMRGGWPGWPLGFLPAFEDGEQSFALSVASRWPMTLQGCSPSIQLFGSNLYLETRVASSMTSVGDILVCPSEAPRVRARIIAHIGCVCVAQLVWMPVFCLRRTSYGPRIACAVVPLVHDPLEPRLVLVPFAAFARVPSRTRAG